MTPEQQRLLRRRVQKLRQHAERQTRHNKLAVSMKAHGRAQAYAKVLEWLR